MARAFASSPGGEGRGLPAAGEVGRLAENAGGLLGRVKPLRVLGRQEVEPSLRLPVDRARIGERFGTDAARPRGLRLIHERQHRILGQSHEPLRPILDVLGPGRRA
jgi:hypothetical protein